MCLILPQINTVSDRTTPPLPPSKSPQTNEYRSHNEGAIASLNLVILVPVVSTSISNQIDCLCNLILCMRIKQCSYESACVAYQNNP